MVSDERVESLMKRAQAGCGGPNAIDCAHDYMADTYGVLGRLLMERNRLIHAMELLYESQPLADSEGWRSAHETAGRRFFLFDPNDQAQTARAGTEQRTTNDADARARLERLVMPDLPVCDCTAECGDDPAIARGAVAKCHRWEAIHTDPRVALALARSEADDYRRQRDDCLAALREIYRDFGECSRIAELCDPLISAFPESA